MQESILSVAVIDADRARAAIVEDGLRAAGIMRVTTVPESADLLDRLKQLAPDVVVIALDSPSRDILEQMSKVSRVVERPVAMFVDRSDAACMRAAIDAGVSAYVVDGLKPERVRAIVDMAVMRFNAYSRMRRELEEARTALADRKTIDKAKGLLMARKGLSETEAYALLRRTAMNEKKRMAEIAQAIITAAELL